MDKKCGCKGIRTCLICEENKSDVRPNKIEVASAYDYCALCNLCYPTASAHTTPEEVVPFYLRGIVILPEFITKVEEAEFVASIDRIPWMPSQSGRKKQDFGPKVNFKKRKVKPGNFKGFPGFTVNLLERLKQVPSLKNFKPVELCHLEYCPDRGSAIDPHLDDSWLWGERLVTLNLLSETSLLLTETCSESAYRCGCNNALGKSTILPSSDSEGSEVPSATAKNVENSAENVLPTAEQPITDELRSVKDGHCFPEIPSELTFITENYTSTAGDILSSSKCVIHDCLNSESLQHFQNLNNNVTSSGSRIVRLKLPPRSLLVLHSCARHHWYHAIQRQDITSRRLAMTLRELASDFLDGGQDSEIGSELLRLAANMNIV